jgi:hypothetical protein
MAESGWPIVLPHHPLDYIALPPLHAISTHHCWENKRLLDFEIQMNSIENNVRCYLMFIPIIYERKG